MPAMMLADGMLGQMMEPVSFPEDYTPIQADKSWATNGHQNKRPHNIVNSLYLQADELEQLVVDRFARYEQVKQNEMCIRDSLCPHCGRGAAVLPPFPLAIPCQMGCKIAPAPSSPLRRPSPGRRQLLRLPLLFDQFFTKKSTARR